MTRPVSQTDGGGLTRQGSTVALWRPRGQNSLWRRRGAVSHFTTGSSPVLGRPHAPSDHSAPVPFPLSLSLTHSHSPFARKYAQNDSVQSGGRRRPSGGGASERARVMPPRRLYWWGGARADRAPPVRPAGRPRHLRALAAGHNLKRTQLSAPERSYTRTQTIVQPETQNWERTAAQIHW